MLCSALQPTDEFDRYRCGCRCVAQGRDSYTPASYYTVTEEGTELERVHKIDPLATQQLYFAFAFSKGTEEAEYTLQVTDKDGNVYTAEFDLAQFEAEQPGGYYTYYEAESGKLYLIVKVSTTNLKGNDLKYDAIAGVSCVYNEKYNYSAFCVLEKDGGTNLNGYPSQYAISPLDSGVCYYLMEVPEVVQQGPVVITVYVGGQYYTLKV